MVHAWFTCNLYPLPWVCWQSLSDGPMKLCRLLIYIYIYIYICVFSAGESNHSKGFLIRREMDEFRNHPQWFFGTRFQRLVAFSKASLGPRSALGKTPLDSQVRRLPFFFFLRRWRCCPSPPAGRASTCRIARAVDRVSRLFRGPLSQGMRLGDTQFHGAIYKQPVSGEFPKNRWFWGHLNKYKGV